MRLGAGPAHRTGDGVAVGLSGPEGELAAGCPWVQIAAGLAYREPGVCVSSSGHKALMTPVPTVQEAISDRRGEGCQLI